jgi:hypothetical protein
MKYVVAGLLASLAMALTMDNNYADEKDKDKDPKYSIKEVMGIAHKGGLYKVVAAGKAEQKQKDQLVELYTSLAQHKSPQGEDKDWKEKTDKMLAAAKGAAKGDAKAAASLLKIVQCGACHEIHK